MYFDLYKFWKVSQKDIQSLISQIYSWRDKFDDGKQLHRFLNENLMSFNDLKRAAAFFIYNRITFSGTSSSGGFSQAAFEERFTESSIL